MTHCLVLAAAAVTKSLPHLLPPLIQPGQLAQVKVVIAVLAEQLQCDMEPTAFGPPEHTQMESPARMAFLVTRCRVQLNPVKFINSEIN